MVSKKLLKQVTNFIDELKKIFGNRLTSVILSDVSTYDSIISKQTEIELIVIVKNITSFLLIEVQRKLSKKMKKLNIKPYFFSLFFLKSSCDVFPIEWKEIKSNYVVLYGKDVIARLVVKPGDIRLQLEREIKQNYINFQHGLVFQHDLIPLLSGSINSLRVIIRNLCEITGRNHSTPGYITALEGFMFEESNISKENIMQIVQSHLDFLEKMVDMIDGVKSFRVKSKDIDSTDN